MLFSRGEKIKADSAYYIPTMCLSLQGKRGNNNYTVSTFCLPKLPTNHLYSIQSFKLDVISTLKIRKLSHREVKQLSYRGYTVNQRAELGLEHGSV